jgi:PilZ domain-containing protein
MSTRHDLRRQDRQACDHSVTVLWRDLGGQDKFFNAKALDISECGLRLQMPEAMATQRYLTLQAPKLGLLGQASVRHCTRSSGSKFVIGVEFTAGMRWTPKIAVD